MKPFTWKKCLSIFVQNKEFRVKRCCVLRQKIQTLTRSAGIKETVEKKIIKSSFHSSQNFSNQQQGALRKLMLNKNKTICVNDTDKNLATANADTFDEKSECRRQRYDTVTYTKLSEETKGNFQLKSIVKKTFIQRKVCF